MQVELAAQVEGEVLQLSGMDPAVFDETWVMVLNQESHKKGFVLFEKFGKGKLFRQNSHALIL